MNSLTVKPESDETVVLGKKVNELQENIKFSEGKVTGTLKHITDYTGFSDQPEEQSGNYLAIKFETDPEDAKITVELTDSPKGPWVMRSDNLVARITNKDTQILKVTAEKDGYSIKKEYSLNELICETE